MKLSEIAKCLGLSCSKEQEITGVSIDSRQTKPQDLFVAFEGEQVDGHDFIFDAIQKGAGAILAQKPIQNLPVPIFVVQDCLKALTNIAVAHRQSLKLKVLALTGSNGKTTVKEMLACILPPSAFISYGNFNNQLGVPINMMSLKSSNDFAVFELGANMVGDIAHTAQLVQADIALINNIGPAHLGKFGSIEQIASAKGEIYQKLSPQGIAVINDDDFYAHFWDDLVQSHEVLRYSSKHKADVWASDIHQNENGTYNFCLHFGQQLIMVQLHVPGRHQVDNALAAASMALAAGVSLAQIKHGLESFSGVQGRLNFKAGLNQSLVIDDTYNANAASMEAGLKVLVSQKGKKIFVMGDIGELEHYAESEHARVGKIAKDLGINELLAVGQQSQFAVQSFGKGALHFNSQEELLEYLKQSLSKEVSVLVKGSRSSKMENIVKQIIQH
jgi:UDP-N-acetylmuramoyl-tripeptide--D-alanyl-D-alanine ligase